MIATSSLWAHTSLRMPVEYVAHRIQTVISIDPCLQKRHKRTFSEDERIQAQANVKKVEEEDPDDIDEPEDAMLLQRQAKDWKVNRSELFSNFRKLILS